MFFIAIVALDCMVTLLLTHWPRDHLLPRRGDSPQRTSAR